MASNYWIWIVVAVLALLALLFGITTTWGIVCFILFLVFLGVALYFVFKDRIKVAEAGHTEAKFA